AIQRAFRAKSIAVELEEPHSVSNRGSATKSIHSYRKEIYIHCQTFCNVLRVLTSRYEHCYNGAGRADSMAKLPVANDCFLLNYASLTEMTSITIKSPLARGICKFSPYHVLGLFDIVLRLLARRQLEKSTRTSPFTLPRWTNTART